MAATSTRRRRDGDRPPTQARPTPPWRGRVIALGATLVVLAVAGAVLFFAPGNSTVQPDPDRVAELEREEGERNAAQVEDLVALTRDTHDAVQPIIGELDAALPPDGGPGTPADLDTVGEWQDTLSDISADLADPPSGSSEYNIARTGLTSSVDLLSSAVTTYALAGEDPDLTELAGSLRTQAVRAWSVAATQLDLLAIDAGLGHIHIYLDSGATEGAMLPDAHPEGAPDDQ